MARKRWSAQDRALGMDRHISRRDVLQGLAAVGSGAWAMGLAPTQALAASSEPDPATYPPVRRGLRGSQPGAFESAHALRDGVAPGTATDTGETYDLVVVGAGISGLAAAWFYRQKAGPGARILLLDNHDDFGGHARRNEFHLDGKLHLANGGTAEIDSPRPYSAVADGLLRSLGLDVEAIAARVPNPEFFRAPPDQRGIFFDRETFGEDRLLTGHAGRTWLHRIDEAPLHPRAKADLLRLANESIDYLPGLAPARKKLLLSKISYADFLREHARVHPQVLDVLRTRTNGEFALDIDAVSALDAWGVNDDLPGMRGLKLPPGGESYMGYTPAGYASTGGSYQLHFPDGNASIARLLVRSLIPAVAPAGPAEGIVMAPFDYGMLDDPASPVRLRLESTVVRAVNIDAGGQAAVAVSYEQHGQVRRVQARHCVLACYNMIIPYLCPEMPERQKAALHSLVKAPLVYTTVALRNSLAFHRLGLRHIEAPGSYFNGVFLNPYMEIGGYQGPRTPEEPNIVHLHCAPCKPGLPEDEQNRAGRAELLATPLEAFERHARDQLGRMLGSAGFDPARDILGVTVNRWPHGYAPEFNPLFDEELPLDLQPHVIGRARFGAITIANSDSGRAAYTDSAIDQGHRAVSELLAGGAA